jgi:hypothetical protein
MSEFIQKHKRLLPELFSRTADYYGTVGSIFLGIELLNMLKYRQAMLFSVDLVCFIFQTLKKL